MRIWIALFVLVAMLLATPLDAAASTTVNMSDLHISIVLPTGWTFERNVTSGSDFYDLEITGPTSGGVQPYGLMDHSDWQGRVDDSSLWAEMKKELDDLRGDPSVSYLIVTSPAVNGTINGTKSCDMTILMTYSGIYIKERIVILASSEWRLGWKLGIGCVNSQWTTYSSDIETIFNSMTVEEAPGLTMVLVGVSVFVTLAVVVVVVVALIRNKDKRERGPPTYQPPQPPGTAPPQPPSR